MYKENINVKMALENDDLESDKFKSNPKLTDPKSKTPVLDSFSRDLTKMAEEGKIEPIIGRDKEILRVSQILGRKKKNNPILIGEPGCVLGETLITVRKTSNLNSHNIING